MAFKVAISAGHYLCTPGKCCHKSLDPAETKEWVLNDRIADKLENILSQYNDIEVLRLDDTSGKKNISLAERSRMANAWRANLYLAIHHNAANRVFDGGGIVAYIHSTNAKKGADAWQKAFYDACIKYTGLKGNRATPLAKAKLYECGAPNMISVLMELGFMDSTRDCPVILTEEFANNIAKALAEVIVERSGAKKVTTGSLGSVTVEMPVLCNGSKGEAVKTLQRLLNAFGYHDATEKPLAVDGSFGPATLYALKNYQDQNKLTVDGKCGQYTWNSLLIY